MAPQPYSLSFTTCSLRINDSWKLVSLYQQHQHWTTVRSLVLDDNLLRQRTTNSSQTVYRELASRLRHLSDEEVEHVVRCSGVEQARVFWVATCRRYAFINDFAVEVLRERYIQLHRQIDYTDFNAFFSSKAVIHDELDRVPETTKKKARQVLFTMMREAELIDRDNTIIPVTLSQDTVRLLARTDTQTLAVFPLTNAALTTG